MIWIFVVLALAVHAEVRCWVITREVLKLMARK